MSDGESEGSAEAPPGKKSTPWSVRKIVEQVTGRPLESMQDPPGTRRAPRNAPSSARDLPLERYHEDHSGALTVLVDPREEEDHVGVRERSPPSIPTAATLTPPSRAEEVQIDRNPSLRAFLPGSPSPSSSGRQGRGPVLPMTRPLPSEVVEEVERLRAEEGIGPIPKSGGPGHGSRELERVYLSYLLMHLDRLTEPALKYLRHAVQEECEERGLMP